jgi:hypothetical protein
MNTAELVHACFVMADSCDAVCDELPSVAEQQRLTLSALSRAFQLTGDRLKREAAEREAKLMEVA